MSTDEWVTAVELARRLSISQQTISRARLGEEATGREPVLTHAVHWRREGKRTLYHVEGCREAIRMPSDDYEVSGGATLADAKARLVEARAKTLELKAGKLAGSLIDAAAARAAWGNVLGDIARAMKRVPERASEQIGAELGLAPGDVDRVRAVIDRVVSDVCDYVAAGEAGFDVEMDRGKSV